MAVTYLGRTRNEKGLVMESVFIRTLTRLLNLKSIIGHKVISKNGYRVTVVWAKYE